MFFKSLSSQWSCCVGSAVASLCLGTTVSTGCGNQEGNFASSGSISASQKTLGAAGTEDDSTRKANPESRTKGDDSKSTGGKRIERTQLVETFNLPSAEEFSDEFSVPASPLQTTHFQQRIQNPFTASTIVLDKEAPNRVISVNGPLSSKQALLVSAVGKPVDIFVVVDDSETFAQQRYNNQKILADRTKRMLKRLLSKLNGTNWQLFISGLPNSTTDDSVSIASTNTANVDAAVDAIVDSILQESSNGDEQTFQGLANLAWNRRGQDRDNAVHAYFVVSDAPNCKDNDNRDSTSCNRKPGSKDHHRYLFEKTNAILPNYMQHMSLFGAYYRMESPAGVCGSGDRLEQPVVGESLVMNSQYADLAFHWEQFLFPNGNLSSPSWVGDICSESEDFSFIDRYAGAVQRLAKHRFPLASAFENFPKDAALNFGITHKGIAIPAANFKTVDNLLAIIAEGPYDSEQLEATGNVNNGYRNSNFLSVLDSPAKSDTVVISWSENGSDKSALCKKASSFVGLDSNVACRHDQNHIFFREEPAYPKLPPARPARSQNLTVRYERDVPAVSSITVTAERDIILPQLTQFVPQPSRQGAVVPPYSQTVNGRVITLSFNAPLPAGLFQVKYFDQSLQSMSIPLPSEIDLAKGLPVCHLPSQTATIGNKGIMLSEGSGLPCSLGPDNKTVSLSSLIPLNAATGQRDLRVSFLSSVAPKAEFELTAPPSSGEVVVRRYVIGDTIGTNLAPSEFTASKSRLSLKNALQPGEKIEADYQFLPDLEDGCFGLSGRAINDAPYRVWIGESGQEIELKSTQYKISDVLEQTSELCLGQDVLKHGLRVKISYLAGVVVTDN